MIHIAGTPPSLTSPCFLWQSVLPLGTLIASSTAAGSFPENVLGPGTYDDWTPASLPATLDVELDDAAECDCAAIVAHNLGSTGATLTVQVDDGGWQTLITVSPEDDSTLFLIGPAETSLEWRFQITGTDVPSLGVVMLGKRMIVPGVVRPDYVPADAAMRVETQTPRSLGGHFFGALVFRRGLQNSVSFSPLPRSFVDGALRPFRAHYDEGGTFIFAASPQALPRDAAYCWRPESGAELRPALMAGGSWATVNMGVEGYGA